MPDGDARFSAVFDKTALRDERLAILDQSEDEMKGRALQAIARSRALLDRTASFHRAPPPPAR